ncbi:MAG TPA: right-handed parallel beta-helix repeat-containing protein [Verrucomicrobiota bacterium]|nr:right-handed parallel beta-helix repeat-containing protein [Verrucomicrobiota bacterium]HNU53094.1 right-handed parallel beta-helix repeat-containing protein [Verrucomicrobiota bacterium]
MNPKVLFPIVVALMMANPLQSATFTVVNTNSTGPGSLEQAILDANANAGADVIAFDLATGGFTIRPTNALPVITDPVTLDGTTQPGYAGTPKIEIQGVSAGAAVDGLKIATSNSVIRGLVINRFAGDGIEITNALHIVVEGCYIGLNLAGATDLGNTLNGILITHAADNTIGGLTQAARNHIAGNNQSGIHLSGAASTHNLVLGNVIGLNVASTAVPNAADGIRVNAPGNVIGAAGAGNIISGNTGQGIEITAAGTGTVVRGNSIGTDETAALDRGNSIDGILVYAGAVIIGGDLPGEGNLITGNNGDGIELNGASATNAIVLGNTLGVSAALQNSGNGVWITGGARGTIVGGIAPGQGNRVVGNGAAGIGVAASNANTNHTFRGNLMHSNEGLGIDLAATGVAPNDPNDGDTSANRLQNYPLLTAVTSSASDVTIAGLLDSTPNTLFAVDFYANTLFDPSGYGEGEIYLGSAGVTTDDAGDALFILTLPVVLPGRYVTATATDPQGNTSEFSPAVVADSTVPTATFTVVNTDDSGPGSLRQAILEANTSITGGPDEIRFAIPGPGPHVIAPLSALPPLADPVLIDGYTQPDAIPNTLSAGNNAVLKIRLDGNSAPNNVSGLTLWGGNSTVRGLAITRFKSTAGHGIRVLSDHNTIEGNYLGVSPDGAPAQGNGGDGILVTGASNLVGGPTPAASNLIAGNSGDGIELNGASSTANVVLGNTLGISSALKNTGNGVFITSGAHDNIIGGLPPGHPNTIVASGKAGISVAAATANTNNTFRGNIIYANATLGIDLGANNATVNDTTDADVGANQLQNFPVLASATTNSPTALTVTGSLTSAAGTPYALDFYANAAMDSTGFGEGQYYLGSASVTTDGTGHADFDLLLPVTPPGRFIAATATDPNGNTSEFSRWTITVTSTPPTNTFEQAADFVFIIDASVSMAGEIAAVKNGLGSFVAGLNTALIDARFAVVLFGAAPELILDFTRDPTVTETAFDLISVNGPVPGVHYNHNANPEAGLEAIRIVLQGATNSTLVRDNAGGSGPLLFRPDARKNLILVTDENSDRPYYAENRMAGQTTTEPPTTLNAAWQAEVDATAQVVLAHNAFLNVLISASGASRYQYGDPSQSAADPDFLNFDPDATLANLVAAGFGGSLEAQVLAAGLVGRAFNIASVDTPNFINNFFAAKVEEIIDNPIPPPRLVIAAIPDAVELTWPTNSYGFLLETNRALNQALGWGVWTTNYGVAGTNFIVTDTLNDSLRFYRLRK